MKRVSTLMVAALLVVGLTAAGDAQYTYPSTSESPGTGLKPQLATAITHAGFAASGDTLGYVRQHLGHALNCLEGTRGPNFNRAWGHVCQGQGNGILTDLKAAAGAAAYVRVAEHADALAVAGVKSRDLTEARVSARAVGALLTIIQDSLK